VRGMPENFLFMGTDIYDFVETQKTKLKKAYEALPDEQALDEAYAAELKKRYMLDIPSLRPEEWSAEHRELSHGIEVLAYVPFDGDPSVFNLRPSAMKMTVAKGEIVDHDWRIRIMVGGPHIDVAGMVKRELAEVQWRLESLRGSMKHMNQQLEAQLHACIAQRKRIVENKANVPQNIGIPPRKPAAAPVPLPTPTLAPPTPEPVALRPSPAKPVDQTWDIFMSHASPDKPYVRGLVKALRAKDVSVWFDEDCIKPGEPSRQAIKNGLKKSTYGIVVLSPAYIADRKWTEHEFDALFAREELNSFIIMPVWHGVSKEDVKKYDPALADRNSISKKDDYDEIVQNILKLLGRVPDSAAALSAHTPSIPPVRKYGPNERDLISYVLYYAPEGHVLQMYVRKVRDHDDLFTLEEIHGPVHEGTREEIAEKFSSIHGDLLRSGLKHEVSNSSSAYPDFTIGG
jgi:hypothetical protein